MDSPRQPDPTISIIVPARNEAACLARCLESLVSQWGVNFEIIVIDDESTDRTREIAESFPSIRVIDAAPLQDGWTGKNNAVFTGASQARGSWLLFTDADTVHHAGSLAKALAEAQRDGASLLSYSPEQEVRSFWEKALMPVIFAELAAEFPPFEVNNPLSSTAAANGQYLLISRIAYDAIGGHSNVASSLLEDVDLARAVKASGRKIRFRYGGDAVRTRMYRDFAQLREGWTKNLALLFGSSIKLASLRFTESLLITGSIAAAAILAIRGALMPAAFAVGISLVLYFQFLLRIRRAHFRWDANTLSIFGLPILSYLLIRSQVRHNRGKVCWKGRSYDPTPNHVAAGVPTCPAGQHSAR